jgi:excinuclease UvrABC nuclease subunit
MTLIVPALLPVSGVSKNVYQFFVYTVDHVFNENYGGVYIFSLREKDNAGKNKHSVIYVGKTVKFNQRFESHEKWEEALKLGLNAICVLQVNTEKEMISIEKDIIPFYNPPLNTHHST